MNPFSEFCNCSLGIVENEYEEWFEISPSFCNLSISDSQNISITYKPPFFAEYWPQKCNLQAKFSSEGDLTQTINVPILINFSASYEPFLLFSPDKIDINIYNDSSIETTINVTNNNSFPVSLSVFVENFSHESRLKLSGSSELASGDEIDFFLNVTPIETGTFDYNLTFVIFSDNILLGKNELPIHLNVSDYGLLPPLLSPDELIINVTAGNSIGKQVSITNTNNISLHYNVSINESVYVNWFEISPKEFDLHPDENLNLTLEVKPPLSSAEDVDCKLNIRVFSNSTSLEKYELPVHLNISAFTLSPLQLFPDNLSISAKKGDILEYSFNVTNNNNESLSCNVSVEDQNYSDWFEFSPFTFELEAGENKEINFTIFVPNSAEGNHNFNLSIFSKSYSNLLVENLLSFMISVESSDESSDEDDHGGGSSGGGGSGGSPEPASNVRGKELSQQFVTNGNRIRFEFVRKVTPVVYVEFDSKRIFGKTTAIVEELTGRSLLTPVEPPGKVYKYLNIWVGNSGFASPENIAEPRVGFKVEKAWIVENGIEGTTIFLCRYSDEGWSPLHTKVISEDEESVYFEAQTSGFSLFAIAYESNHPDNELTCDSIEPARNIKFREISQNFIENGELIRFEFIEGDTPVVYVEFYSIKNLRKTTAIVEELKGRSFLTKANPPGDVYRYLNIWVGDCGFATSQNIANVVVGFRVSKTWISENAIDNKKICLYRCSDGGWSPLQTIQISEDEEFVYFEAQTFGFSNFAVINSNGIGIDSYPIPDFKGYYVIGILMVLFLSKK